VGKQYEFLIVLFRIESTALWRKKADVFAFIIQSEPAIYLQAAVAFSTTRIWAFEKVTRD
jgi:hypothetical protein